MYFPKQTVLPRSRVKVNSFAGLDRRPGATPGGFFHMENLTASAWPALSTRPARSVAAQLSRPGGLAEKDALIWVDGSTLSVGGVTAGPLLTEGEKQLVSMGAWLLIWPDKVYLNTQNLSDWGYLEQRHTTTGTVTCTLCRPDGTAYEAVTAAETAPEEAAEGSFWLDTAGQRLLRRDTGTWTAVEEACVSIAAPGIGAGFAAGDGVTLSGLEEASLNGSAILQQVTADALVIPGLLAAPRTQTTPVTVARTVPDMDFVVECGNRLWGCKYGMVEGRAVNEIYACRLGDFKNWNVFAGLSTDSYAASRGSDGPFTGAAACLGSVLFFKERCMERVYPAAGGAHRIVTTPCCGVAPGSHKSLQTVDGKLYYLSPDGVMRFDGSLPLPVSAPLGDWQLQQGVAGSGEGTYLLSAADQWGGQHLLVYDVRRGLWHRQDDTCALAFAGGGSRLYCLRSDGAVLDLSGRSGQKEEPLRWEAVTGPLGLEESRGKYLTRLIFQLEPEAGSTVHVALSYDDGATWQQQGEVTGTGKVQRCQLQLRPRRCHRLLAKIGGEGGCRLLHLTAVYEKGSEQP